MEQLDTEDQLAAWPNQAEAAEILGVNESTLSRRKPAAVSYGGREKRLSPRVVLEQAVHFRVVPLRQVAAELIDLAEARAPQFHAAVQNDVRAFLAERRGPAPSMSAFLTEAKSLLPPKLFKQVLDAYQQGQKETEAAVESPGFASERAEADITPRMAPEQVAARGVGRKRARA
jgi:hypothetical protein